MNLRVNQQLYTLDPNLYHWWQPSFQWWDDSEHFGAQSVYMLSCLRKVYVVYIYISYDPYESQPYKGHLTSKFNYRRLPSYLLCTLFLYFLFIFYLPRCTLPHFPSISSIASLPFLSCCHRTTKCLCKMYICHHV